MSYSYSRLGQNTTTMEQPIPAAVQYAYLPGVTRFTTNMGPGQPYKLDYSNEEIEKALYKEIPTEVGEKSPAATSPQAVYKLENGLEVPAYILERKKQRELLEQTEEEREAKEQAPGWHQISIFAAKNPGVATLAALAIGSWLGHWYIEKQ